jgi:hypothetical protein
MEQPSLLVAVVGVQMVEDNISAALGRCTDLVALYCVDCNLCWAEDGVRQSVNWTVRRRFSEFARLEKEIQADQWGLPRMPPKRASLAIMPEVCEERLRGLNAWLQAAMQRLPLASEALSRLIVFLSPPAELDTGARAQLRLLRGLAAPKPSPPPAAKPPPDSPRSVMYGRKRLAVRCSPVSVRTGGRALLFGSPASPANVVEKAQRWLEERIGAAGGAPPCPEDDLAAVRRHHLFVSSTPPVITAADYLSRLVRYALEWKEPALVEAVVMHALLLLERVEDGPTGLCLCDRTVHRLLLAALLISAKLLDDETYSTQRWALAGGVPCCHLSAIELELAAALSFHLMVSPNDIERLRSSLLIPPTASATSSPVIPAMPTFAIVSLSASPDATSATQSATQSPMGQP